MQSIEMVVDTSRQQIVDITEQINRALPSANGLVNIFVQHATAGVAVIETGAGSEEDLVKAIDRLLPRQDIYQHRHGAVGHGADHVLPAFISPSVSVPVNSGRMMLGTWQRIVVVDPNVDKSQRNLQLTFVT